MVRPTGLAFRGKVRKCRRWQGAPDTPEVAVTCRLLLNTASMSLAGSSTRYFGWTEGWSLQPSQDGSYGGDQISWTDHIIGHFWEGVVIEPHPASGAFHEWTRKYLQMTWSQNLHQLCCLFWASLIAFGSTQCSVFHQISLPPQGIYYVPFWK